MGRCETMRKRLVLVSIVLLHGCALPDRSHKVIAHVLGKAVLIWQHMVNLPFLYARDRSSRVCSPVSGNRHMIFCAVPLSVEARRSSSIPDSRPTHSRMSIAPMVFLAAVAALLPKLLLERVGFISDPPAGIFPRSLLAVCSVYTHELKDYPFAFLSTEQ